MVNVKQLLLSALSLQTPLLSPPPADEPLVSNSIAVIGAGSAGLAMLKTVLDFPQEVRESWTIDVFDEREDTGGVW